MITDTTIQNIMDKFELGKCNSWEKFRKGIGGVTFNINDAFVMKINQDTLDPFRAERNAEVIQLLAKHHLPVSQFIGLDISLDIIPDKYILCRKLVGDDLGKSWKTFPPEEQRNVFLSFGKILAEFHKIKLDRYGFIADDKTFPTWAAFIDHKYRGYYSYIERHNIVPSEILQEFEQFYQRNKHLLNIDVEPVFVHNDFQAKNVKYVNGKITGVFDFDECLSGHNEHDFIKLYLPFKKEREYLDVILEGYRGNGGEVSKEFRQRLTLYCMIFCLKVLSYIHANNIDDEPRSEKFRQAIKDLLEEGKGFV
jgi:aminoglycoside phosphotransferase (APT) family kinase protein